MTIQSKGVCDGCNKLRKVARRGAMRLCNPCWRKAK